MAEDFNSQIDKLFSIYLSDQIDNLKDDTQSDYVIEGINGKKVKRKFCISYKDKYYKKSDCVPVLGIYIPKDNNSITYDNTQKKWFFKKDMHLFLNNDKVIEFVKFIPDESISAFVSVEFLENFDLTFKSDEKFYRFNTSYNVPAIKIFCNSENILKEIGLIENYKSGHICSKDIYSLLGSIHGEYIGNCVNEMLQRSSSKITKQLLWKVGVESPTFIMTEQKNYSFGVEIETSGGVVPYRVSRNLNMESKRDGSIRCDDRNGYCAEYATGILRGDMGMIHLHKIFNELSKRCTINKSCSIHVHLGIPIDTVDNIKTFDREFIVYLFKLLKDIEEEIMQMMPPSRRSNEYCRLLPDINIDFSKNDMELSNDIIIRREYEKVANTYTSKTLSSLCNKKLNHPRGQHCGYDRSTTRYCWANLVPTVFNTRKCESYTVEFRVHYATLNFDMIKKWIMLLMGIMSYAEGYKSYIRNKKVTLEDIINGTYKHRRDYLLDYILNSKTKFLSLSSTAEEKMYTSKVNVTTPDESSIKQIIKL